MFDLDMILIVNVYKVFKLVMPRSLLLRKQKTLFSMIEAKYQIIVIPIYKFKLSKKQVNNFFLS